MEDHEPELSELRELKVAAPGDTLGKLRRRVRAAQLGKEVVERQALAGWLAADALLKKLAGKGESHE